MRVVSRDPVYSAIVLAAYQHVSSARIITQGYLPSGITRACET
jgi:hypothetical protein